MFGIFKRLKRLEEAIRPRYNPTSWPIIPTTTRISDLEKRVEMIERMATHNAELFHAFMGQQGYKWEEKTEKKWVKKSK